MQWLRWPIPKIVTKRESAPPDPPAVAKPSVIAVLMYSGVSNIHENTSEISIDRVAAGSYRLRVHSATEGDQGMYKCQAEAWGQDPHGGWYNTGGKAESNPVTVYLYARGKSFLWNLLFF